MFYIKFIFSQYDTCLEPYRRPPPWPDPSKMLYIKWASFLRHSCNTLWIVIVIKSLHAYARLESYNSTPYIAEPDLSIDASNFKPFCSRRLLAESEHLIIANNLSNL
ncbi:unnamed protein product [Lactuca saligna]|uniref:Uncharacterized protein n=1 Tax=Lactuca saligna TaxID=75948 RepID=A0AA35ZAF6_LACSI|nr:unnamed protein product [Lactuca saligna]